MWHQPTLSALIQQANFQEVLNDAQQLKALWLALCLHLSTYSRLPPEKWAAETESGEFWLIAPLGLQAGVIDEIVPPIKAPGKQPQDHLGKQPQP